MKNKHIFSLLDTSFTTVAVVFGALSSAAIASMPITPGHYHMTDDDYFSSDPRMKAPPAPPQQKQLYVFKVPKLWDVKVGQVLVVPGKDTLMSFVTVVRVDEVPEIDIDANHDYKWAIQAVDTTEYEALVDNEKRFKAGMMEVERTKQRELLVNSFRDSLPEGSEARRLFDQTTAVLSPPTSTNNNSPPWDGADAPADDNRSPLTDTGTA